MSMKEMACSYSCYFALFCRPPFLLSFFFPFLLFGLWLLAVAMVFFQSRHTSRLSFLPLFADGGMWRSRGSGP